MKIAFAFLFAVALIMAGPCWSAAAYAFSAEAGQLSVAQSASIAEKQFEITKLLIKEGRFDRVLPEMRKILDLNLQGEYEQSVAQSSGLIAGLLEKSRQTSIAHELLDETLARMKQCGNIIPLLQIKAYIYKSEGKTQKAIDLFERAVEMERQCPK